ncbi:vWA domain-containing protein, partial [Vibrio metoecus]
MASFEFIWWWAFLLLPLPWLIYFFAPAIQSRAAIK